MGMPQQKIQVAALKSDKATEMADYHAITQDLGFVMQCCTKLLGLLEEPKQDGPLIRALYTAALVAYVRCFSTGVRSSKVNPEIFASIEGALQRHQSIKDMRDKHIAHSVNAFEDTSIGAMLSNPTTGQKMVVGTIVLTGSRVSDSAEGIKQIGSLAKIAFESAKARFDALQIEVLAEARALNIDELYARPTPRFTAPSYDVVAKSRSADSGGISKAGPALPNVTK